MHAIDFKRELQREQAARAQRNLKSTVDTQEGRNNAEAMHLYIASRIATLLLWEICVMT